MAYGLQIWDSSGVELFNSTTVTGGWVAGVMFGTTSTISTSYPSYAGRTGVTYQQGPGPTAVWDYALGYPRVTIAGDPVAKAAYINMVK